MAWTGDSSDYDEGDEGDDTETDIEDLPDEELIVVLRDEQNSIKEAQRLVRKEIKSIRRDVKRLLRQCTAATHAEPQGLGEHHGSIDSGLSCDTNYMTDYTTASELASSLGDSEAGYQAFLEYDTDGSSGHLRGDGRYHWQSPDVYESGSGYEEDAPIGYPPSSYKGQEGAGSRVEQQSKTENGFQPGYGMPPQWSGGDAPEAAGDHTRGRNSTYEDAYSMVRRRHNGDTATRNSKSKTSGNRWRAIIQKHGDSIYSMPKSDQGHPKMREDSRLHPKGQESVQSSEGGLRHVQDFSGSGENNNSEQPRRHGFQSINSGQITKKLTRNQSAHQFDVKKLTLSGSTTPDVNRETISPQRKTQSSQFLSKPNSINAVPSDKPPSVASESNLPIRQWNNNSRTSAMSSEDEARDSPRYTNSSYDSYMDTKYSGRSLQRELSRHRHREGSMNSPRQQHVFSGNAGSTGSGSSISRTGQSNSVIDDRHRNAALDENWNKGPSLASQSDIGYQSSAETYRDSYAGHKGMQRPRRNTEERRLGRFPRDMGKGSPHTMMKV